ncbi:aspartate kinase [Sulfodiicoccus acidiphilus]|uniref:aspartate kinase n=1 Tax=Sulfodiicoccus acidiphilus TaxID=1670455 RepID=UPI000F8455DE|nr:aspartate kinase [Sulfodiicoccus acidiphilus]
MLVVKIGGSILSDHEVYGKIADKLSSLDADRVVVVTSALRNVTNELLAGMERRDQITEIVSSIYDRHLNVLSKIADGVNFERAFQQLSKLSDELFRVAWSVKVLDEITPRVRDYVLSFGERMSVVLLDAALRTYGLITSGLPEPVMVTDENFGEANVIEFDTSVKLRELIGKSDSKVLVVPGFIGVSPSGKLTTVGRGGSDYTATLVGRFLGAEEVRLVTEVPGIMTGDPKRFPGAKTISRLSLEEALELALLGVKRFHPRTFEPMFQTNLRVRVENLTEPGCTIVEGTCSDYGIKGVAIIDDAKVLSVESTRMAGKVGSAAAIMSEAKDAQVNLISFSQPASETTIQLLVNSDSSTKLRERLRTMEGKLIKAVHETDASAVSVVGCGLRSREMFKRVLEVSSGYDVLSVSRGLNRVSVTFVVERSQGEQLAKELHRVVVSG